MKNEEKILVSVICNTYNHGKYIKECLESIVNQKTNFKFEVLVHDDASTDNTAVIVREYEKAYPNIIKPIYQKVNQYSQGHSISELQSSRANGKYIALCEGDDYWTDDYKLQKQVDALEQNTTVDICAHSSWRIDALTLNKLSEISPAFNNTIIPVEDVIMGEGGFVATNSIVYRSSLNSIIPSFRKILRLDYSLQIQGSLRGGMLFLKDNMSVYRYMVPNSWTANRTVSMERKKDLYERKQKMLKQLDIDTNKKYHEVIYKRITKNEFEYLLEIKSVKEALNSKYKTFLKEIPIFGRIKLFILGAFPFLSAINLRIKNITK